MTPRVYLAVPTYSQWLTTGAVAGIMTAAQPGGVLGKSPVPQFYPTSLLTKGFNVHWAQAIIGGFDLFAMLHADICPEPGWLDTSVESLLFRDADLVSASVRLKDRSFEYSVAIDTPEGPVRLNKAELDALPDVFDRNDVGKLLGLRTGGALLVNTGCFVANLRKPWVRSVGFQINTSIEWFPDGHDPAVALKVEPEDWGLSRQLYNLGATGVYGTTRVRTRHLGDEFYDSHVELADDLREKLSQRIRLSGPKPENDRNCPAD